MRRLLKAFFNRTQLQRSLLGMVVGLVVGGVFAWSLHAKVPILERWELALVDSRYEYFGKPAQVSSDLVVVGIDEATLREMAANGLRMPFRRWVYSDLIDVLQFLGAKAIVLDVAFSDQVHLADPIKDPNPFDLISLDLNDDQRAFRDADAIFGKKLYSNGRVAIGLHSIDEESSVVVSEAHRLGGRHPRLAPYVTARIPTFASTGMLPPTYPPLPGKQVVLMLPQPHVLVGARALGYVNTRHTQAQEAGDSVLRKFAPLVEVDGLVVADLPIAAYQVALCEAGTLFPWVLSAADPPPPDARPSLPAIALTRGTATIGKTRIPLGDDGLAWINWRGNWLNGALYTRTHSMFKLLKHLDDYTLGNPVPEIDPKDFAGKIVLVGVTAQGDAGDFASTPFGSQPGVYRHAAALDTLLSRDFLRSVPSLLQLIAILVLSIVTGALVLGLPLFAWQVNESALGQFAMVLWKVLPGGALMAAYGFAAFAAFGSRWVAGIVHPELAMAFVTLFSTLFAYVFIRGEREEEKRRREEEQRKKEQALSVAKKALSADVVDSILARNPEGKIELGGKRVPLTLYFSDIAGFTTISEKLSPDDLVLILNEYLTRVTEILVRQNAYIDKYIGDAVMAFWGAPEPDPGGPVKACLAAIEVMAEIDKYSAELIARGLSPLKTRIGINSGPAVAGAMGHPDKKFNYTAMGDTVNLASRLEGSNKAYGTTCMLGPATYEAVKDVVLARELDLVKVKGKNIPVRVFELMGRAEDPLPREREIKRRYEAALAQFRTKRFAEARTEFKKLLDELGDPPSKTLLAACDQMIAHPPAADWDGSNELHEK